MANTKELLGNSFLSNYLQYVEKQESPDDFHLWTAMTVVGASTQRAVWYDQTYHQIFCNLYTAIISPSAVSRKSSAMNIGMDLFHEAFGWSQEETKMKVIRGKVTPQALLKSLALSSIDESFGAHAFIQSDELSVMLGGDVRTLGIIDLLTELYTCPKAHDHETKTSGSYHIKDAFISILGASVPSYLQNTVGAAEIEGFVGRFGYTYKEDRKISSPRIKNIIDKEKLKTLRGVLVEQLQMLGEVCGDMDFTPDAGEIYDRWYEEIPKKARLHGESSTVTSGFVGRKGDHAIKIAMILALTKNPSNPELVIDKNSIEGAIDLIETSEASMRKIFDYTPKGDVLGNLKTVEEFISQRRRVMKSVLNAKFRYKIEIHKEMFSILRSLEQAGIILKEREGQAEYLYYIPEFIRREAQETNMHSNDLHEKVKEWFWSV